MDNTRPTPRHGSLLSFAGVMVVLLTSGPTLGQMRDSDPRAAEAFAEVIAEAEAMRQKGAEPPPREAGVPRTHEYDLVSGKYVDRTATAAWTTRA